MKIHTQIITKNKHPEYVVIPYAEYEAILELIELQEDMQDIRDFHAGDKETIPFELVEAMANSKSPVRAAREYRGILQAQLAKDLNISRQYLSQIEQNQRKGSAKTLKSIAKALDIDIEFLI